ncbi:MAG: hypothetical protein AAF928_10225 [Myxococcota bacterium]
MKRGPVLTRLYPRLIFLFVIAVVTLVAYALLRPADVAERNAEVPPSQRSVPGIPATPPVP